MQDLQNHRSCVRTFLSLNAFVGIAEYAHPQNKRNEVSGKMAAQRICDLLYIFKRIPKAFNFILKTKAFLLMQVYRTHQGVQ